MGDLEELRRELERKGKLSALESLSATPEAAALQRRVRPEQLNSPEGMRAALEAALRSPEGQALAKKIREAMEHG